MKLRARCDILASVELLIPHSPGADRLIFLASYASEVQNSSFRNQCGQTRYLLLSHPLPMVALSTTWSHYPNDHGPYVVVANWIFKCVMVVTVATRLATRVRTIKKIGIDDTLVLIAAVSSKPSGVTPLSTQNFWLIGLGHMCHTECGRTHCCQQRSR